MTFPINITVPGTNNDPADDQPIMQQNYANIAGYLGIDHIAPGAVGDGFHKQVTFFTENIPGAVTDPVSVSFTANANNLGAIVDTATTVAQAYYKNNNGIFPQSAVRVFASFQTSGADVITYLNTFNITTITSTGPRLIYTINFVANATNGTNYIFIPGAFTGSYGVTKNANQVVITFSSTVTSGRQLDFMILQA